MDYGFLLILSAAPPMLFWRKLRTGRTAHGPVYPIVLLDALRVKILDAESRQVKNKAVYIALGVTPDREREVPGLWIAANEGADSGSQS